MKKFWITVLCIAVTVISLAGCGTASGSSAKNQQSCYSFITGYQQIYINEDAQTLTDALWTPPSGTYEALSCAFEGKDTFYYYDGFTLQTYEKDGKKYIYTITLEDDTVNTAEGIKIGDSFAAVTKAYGTDYVAAGNTYAYSKDKMTLTYVINYDKDARYNIQRRKE